eukprot:343215-Alexandrium_andersonii.AAC.1
MVAISVELFEGREILCYDKLGDWDFGGSQRPKQQRRPRGRTDIGSRSGSSNRIIGSTEVATGEAAEALAALAVG